MTSCQHAPETVGAFLRFTHNLAKGRPKRGVRGKSMADASKIEHGNLTRAGKGRPIGAKNKTTSSAKSIIEGVTDRLGGIARLTAWVQEAPENERVFWSSIFTKLIPVQVGADPENPLTITMVERRIVDVGD